MIYGRHRLPTKDNTLKVPGGTIRVNGKIKLPVEWLGRPVFHDMSCLIS